MCDGTDNLCAWRTVEKETSTVHLSNNTVKRRVKDLSTNTGKKNGVAFSLELDGSTDVLGLAVILVSVRYLFQNRTEQNLLSKRALLKHLPFPTS